MQSGRIKNCVGKVYRWQQTNGGLVAVDASGNVKIFGDDLSELQRRINTHMPVPRQGIFKQVDFEPEPEEETKCKLNKLKKEI